MAWYKRSSRFMVDAFHCHNLKTTAAPKIPLQKSVSTITFSHKSSSTNSRVSGYCQPLLRSFVSQNALKNRQRYKSPFLDGSKRFFHSVDTNNKVLKHFKPKGFKFWTGLLGFGVVISAYYWNLERVPYTKRSHFVLFSTSLEKEFGVSNSLEIIKLEYEGKILPPLHPLSIRVQRIGQEIVEAAQKGLRKEEESLIIKKFKKLGKRDYHQIPQFEWEFVVVDDPNHYFARTYPGGKFVLSTNCLDYRESDAELAATIGHEVGHAIARHPAEHVSRLPGLIILNLFLCWRITLHLIPAMSKLLARLAQRHSAADKVSRLRCPKNLKLFLYFMANLSLIHAISKFLITLPNSRRREMEADYIGLILVALAGYDPRVVVELWENDGKLLENDGWPLFEDYLYTHPSVKKRAQLLSQPKVMKEALSLYREVSAQWRDDVDPHISRNIILNTFRRFLIRDKV